MSELKTERTQEATPHRRDQMRRTGPVVRSPDLLAALFGLVACVGLIFWGAQPSQELGGYLSEYLGGDAWRTVATSSPMLMQQSGVLLAKTVLPAALFFAAFVVVCQLGQGGMRWQPDRIRPDLGRMNPAKQLEQLVESARYIGVLATTLKTVVVGFLIGGTLWLARDQVLGLIHVEGTGLAAALPSVILRCGVFASCVLCGIGLIDYALRRLRHEQAMRMTPDEIREESKSRDGDPQLIGRRRSIHRGYASVEREDARNSDAF